MEEQKSGEVEKVLSDEILADARKRAERTVKRAQAEGKKLVERALAEASAVGESALADVEKRVERERLVFDAGLLLEERMRRLKAQGRLLDEVFAQALERLHARPGDYARTVRELAVDAVLAMSGDSFVLVLPDEDLPAMKEHLPAAVAAAVRERGGRAVSLRVAERAAPFHAGVLVESADGRRRVDNSFDGRVHRMQSDLRFEIADMLFGQAEAQTQTKLENRNSKLE